MLKLKLMQCISYLRLILLASRRAPAKNLILLHVVLILLVGVLITLVVLIILMSVVLILLVMVRILPVAALDKTKVKLSFSGR